jgi:hypothetical protein
MEHFGRAREAHQCYPYVGLPNHDDHSTFRRYVSLKPFGGEHSQRVLASLWLPDMLSCSVSEADRYITIFTLAATPLACSAVMHSKHPDG